MDRYAISASGGCQCGAVRYHATKFADNPHICHCRMCQKAVGNYFAALISVRRDHFSWTRGTPSRFRSSEHVDRGFCAKCGTPLFYEDITGSHLSVTLGSLDEPNLFPPRTQDGMQGRVTFFDSLAALPDTGDTGSDAADWAASIKATNHQHPDHDTEQWP